MYGAVSNDKKVKNDSNQKNDTHLANCTDRNWEPVSHQSKLEIRNKSSTPKGYLWNISKKNQNIRSNLYANQR